ncbi:hypothetical protein [Clostridium sp. UBA1652]|uniref:hypothetical protein n=1 Tax=Clostridium sp. UBA1652 TaxID=1946348 RepID=UPI00257B79CE|nr:hypothetical protein [Clostridium sp. UBA1652]
MENRKLKRFLTTLLVLNMFISATALATPPAKDYKLTGEEGETTKTEDKDKDGNKTTTPSNNNAPKPATVNINVSTWNGYNMHYKSGLGHYVIDNIDNRRYRYNATQETAEFKKEIKIRNYAWTVDFKQTKESTYSRENNFTTPSNTTTFTAPRAGYYYVTAVPVVWDTFGKYTRTLYLAGEGRNGDTILDVKTSKGVTATYSQTRQSEDYPQTWLKRNWEIYLDKGQPFSPISPSGNTNLETDGGKNGGGSNRGNGNNTGGGTIIKEEVQGLDTKTSLVK